jgi:hypothetical protein
MQANPDADADVEHRYPQDEPHWATGQSPVYPSGRPNPVHCSRDPFVWRFWPTDADPRDHYSGKNYSDVAEDDGVDDGNGPAPVGAAGQDGSDSDRSSGLSLSSDDEARGHSGSPLRTPSSDGDSPVVSANGVLRRRRVRRRLDLSDDRRRPPFAEREAEYAACEGMAAGRPSWEGRDSPDEEEHTMVGSCEEVRYGEDGQWSPDNLV